jgi:hypothetical protein
VGEVGVESDAQGMSQLADATNESVREVEAFFVFRVLFRCGDGFLFRGIQGDCSSKPAG